MLRVELTDCQATPRSLHVQGVDPPASSIAESRQAVLLSKASASSLASITLQLQLAGHIPREPILFPPELGKGAFFLFS